MDLEIDRDTIKAFILNELSDEMMSLVADAIDADMRLKRMYEEEKFEIDAKLYYANLMSPTDRSKFQQRLIKRMKFCSDVNQHEEKNISPEELRLRRSVCEASQSKESSTPKTLALGMTIKRWLVAASVTVVLMVGGGLVYHSQTDDSLENRLYTEYYTPLNQKDFYLFNNNSLSVAKQKYIEGDYTNALLLLKDLPLYVTIEVEKNLYIGLSLMEIGQYKGAIGYLEGITASQSNFNYTPQVRWYLGLCYLKAGDKGKAVNTFRAIVDDNGYNYKKAKQILEKLGS